MFEIKGRYSTIKVMLPPGIIDESTIVQLKTLSDFAPLGGASLVIMPDCHAGKGCVVGTTIKDFPVVIPNLVGVDISCGMYIVPTPRPLESSDEFARFDMLLRKNIPSGFNINPKQEAELSPDLEEKFCSLASKIGVDKDKVINAIGSLGGGNHFVELDQSPNGEQILVIHSGSRNFGLQICNFHQKRAAQYCQSKGVNVPQGLEYLPFGGGAEEYLSDMEVAQRYAEVNRETIGIRLLKLFFGDIDLSKAYHCTHNYISDMIIRKGAISAKLGERVVIPLNMRDGVVIGTGMGSEEWNFSAPHGAGRIYSRGQSKRHLTLKDFQNDMQGIWTSSVSQETLDESPSAYKPSKLIIESIGETVNIEAVYKPVYNFKSQDSGHKNRIRNRIDNRSRLLDVAEERDRRSD